MLSRYQRIPDSGQPTTERFAEDLFVSTPLKHRPEGASRQGVWEHTPPEIHEAFRERARRFMDGDLSVAPWVSGR